MQVFAMPIVVNLLRTTLALSIAGGLIWFALRAARPASPTAHRAAWLLVLLAGWTFLRVPLSIPWHELPAPPAEVVEVAPPTVEFVELAPWRAPPPEWLDEPIAAPAAPIERPFDPFADDPVAGEPSLGLLSQAQSPIDPTLIEPTLFEPQNSALAEATLTPEIPAQPWRPQWAAIGLFTWLGGMAAIVAVWLFSYLRFAIRLPQSLALDDGWAVEWRDTLAECGVTLPITLRVTRQCGPLLCRLPRGYELLVPVDFWRSLEPSARRAILRHELAHYSRGDLWSSLAARLLALPHWFNPVAWAAVRRWDEAAEWACDALAARDIEVTDYATLLVRLGESATAPVPFAPAASGHTLSTRIKRLLAFSQQEDSKMKKVALVALGIGLLAVAVVRVQLVAKEPPAGPPANVADGPTVSPYLNLMRAESSDANREGDPIDDLFNQPRVATQPNADGARTLPPIAPAAQKVIDAAQAAYTALVNSNVRPGPDLDVLYTWSLRWQSAEQSAARNKGERVAAAESHLLRMRELHRKVQALWEVGARDASDVKMAAADYYVADAERRLAEASSFTEPGAGQVRGLPDSGKQPDPQRRIDGLTFEQWDARMQEPMNRTQFGNAVIAFAKFGAYGYTPQVVSRMIDVVEKSGNLDNIPPITSSMFDYLPHEEATAALIAGLDSQSDAGKQFAMDGLLRLQETSAIPRLLELVSSPSAKVRRSAAHTVAWLDPTSEGLFAKLEQAVANHDFEVLEGAVLSLANRESGSDRSGSMNINALLHSQTQAVREAAALVIARKEQQAAERRRMQQPLNDAAEKLKSQEKAAPSAPNQQRGDGGDRGGRRGGGDRGGRDGNARQRELELRVKESQEQQDRQRLQREQEQGEQKQRDAAEKLKSQEKAAPSAPNQQRGDGGDRGGRRGGGDRGGRDGNARQRELELRVKESQEQQDRQRLQREQEQGEQKQRDAAEKLKSQEKAAPSAPNQQRGDGGDRGGRRGGGDRGGRDGNARQRELELRVKESQEQQDRQRLQREQEQGEQKQRTELSQPTDGAAASPSDKTKVLRYEGKTFEEWDALIQTDLSPQSREKAIAALAAFGPHGYARQVVRRIVEVVGTWSPAGTRPTGAFEAIANLPLMPETIEELIACVKSGNEHAKVFCVELLRYHLKQESIPMLLELLHDPSDKVRTIASSSIARLDPTSVELIAKVQEALKKPDEVVVIAAANVWADAAANSLKIGRSCPVT